nr:E258 [uncultured bacterium]
MLGAAFVEYRRGPHQQRTAGVGVDQPLAWPNILAHAGIGIGNPPGAVRLPTEQHHRPPFVQQQNHRQNRRADALQRPTHQARIDPRPLRRTHEQSWREAAIEQRQTGRQRLGRFWQLVQSGHERQAVEQRIFGPMQIDTSQRPGHCRRDGIFHERLKVRARRAANDTPAAPRNTHAGGTNHTPDGCCGGHFGRARAGHGNSACRAYLSTLGAAP